MFPVFNFFSAYSSNKTQNEFVGKTEYLVDVNGEIQKLKFNRRGLKKAAEMADLNMKSYPHTVDYNNEADLIAFFEFLNEEK